MTRTPFLARASFFLSRLSVPAAIALAAGCAATAHAGPEGEQVRQGNVRFVRDGSGNTVIHASDRAIINYRSFNIGSNESVRFVQPDASSRVLNRINSAAPTRIDGNISSNGRVYIVNPAGVVFGRSSVINVNGLFAAAGNMSDADFNRGIDRVTNMTGRVTNEGLIRVDQGGSVILAGGQVANMGHIVAPQGTVAMAAGTDVVFTSRNDVMHVRVAGPAQGDSQTAAVTNTGTIEARRGKVTMAAGDVYGLAIRTTGDIIARDTTIAGEGAGRVIVGGTINAVDQSGTTYEKSWTNRFNRSNVVTKGGNITITGETVGLFSATLDVSGANGGGQVRIGGDITGSALAGDLRNSTVTVADSATTIRADATQRGDGGSVVLWADGTTRTAAAISAKGGERTGDGGFIETSGKQHLAVDGSRIDASATKGDAGTWLLDPRNVNITSGSTNVTISGTNPEVFTPSQDDSVVAAADITSRLNTGTSVTINTGSDGTQAGDIRVQADIVRNAASGSPTLRLEAANDVIVESGRVIEATGGGSLNVELLANRGSGDIATSVGSVVIESGARITTAGGNVLLAGGSDLSPTLTDPGSAGYEAALRASAGRGGGADVNGVRVSNATIDAGTGSLTMRGVGANDVSQASGVRIDGGSTITAGLIRIDGVGGSVTTPFTELGNAVGFENAGVTIDAFSTTVTSTGGITINGVGGVSAFERVTGVTISDATVTAAGANNAGAINITGLGTTGTGEGGHGVLISGTLGGVTHEGTGAVNISGTARGSGATSHGIVIERSVQAVGASASSLTLTGV
ncbi:MAG TPA: filamentous hemagglutinin N-terminal domain-containing protein, partial [Phycisphaerales bacterium]|nr:filamentous hemagglutinin N-terminal domain-containing protein [Phycisphaerales bacterium]